MGLVSSLEFRLTLAFLLQAGWPPTQGGSRCLRCASGSGTWSAGLRVLAEPGGTSTCCSPPPWGTSVTKKVSLFSWKLPPWCTRTFSGSGFIALLYFCVNIAREAPGNPCWSAAEDSRGFVCSGAPGVSLTCPEAQHCPLLSSYVWPHRLLFPSPRIQCHFLQCPRWPAHPHLLLFLFPHSGSLC